MHALKLLHSKIRDACPSIHVKRLNVLFVATQALLLGRRLTLTGIARSIRSHAYVKHNIKRIDRLLGNGKQYLCCFERATRDGIIGQLGLHQSFTTPNQGTTR